MGNQGRYLLDPVRRQLLRDGAVVALGDRAFDLLLALAQAEGKPVAADDLIARVWPRTTVAAGNLRVQIRALRRALGDDAIENVPGSGYRLALSLLSGPERNTGPEGPPLVGREGDLERVKDLLSRSRLVSIVGPGGVGKTRLALAAAAQCQGMRVVHLDLAALRQRGLIPVAAAAALSVNLMKIGVMEALISALADQPVLMVLDNAEHLLDEVCEFAEAILGACPRVQMLLTSREPLNLGGEMLLHLCPLGCPPPDVTDPAAIRDYDAVRLVLREQRVEGRPDPDDSQMPTLARLCRHLDGLPLALLLLAALLREGTVDTVAAAFEGRLRDVPLPDIAGYRHDNLRRMLDWSIDLLSEEEGLLLGRLAVFAESWPVDAAVAVCGQAPLTPIAVPGLVASLVSRSLVAGPLQTQRPGMRLLETVRDHVMARNPGLIDREGLRQRLAAWLTGEFRERERAAAARIIRASLGALDAADIHNVLTWALGGGDIVLGQRLALDSTRYWNLRGLYTEGVRYLELAWNLCGPDTPPAIRAQLGLALYGESFPIRLPYHSDRERYVREELEGALIALRDGDVPPGRLFDAYLSAGYLRRYTGDPVGCNLLWDQALAVAESNGHWGDQIRALTLSGTFMASNGELVEARRRFARALDIAERQDLKRYIILMRLADVEFVAGDLDRAVAAAREGLSFEGELPPAVAQTLLANLSSYLLVGGRLREAVVEAEAARKLVQKYTYGQAWTLERGALVLWHLGQTALARRLAAMGDKLVRELGLNRTGPERAVHQQLIEGLGPVGEPDAGDSPEALISVLGDCYAAYLAGTNQGNGAPIDA